MITKRMECQCIRAAEIPHTTRLYADYLDNFPAVSEFYTHPPTLEAVQNAAREVSIDPDVRRDVCEILREQNRKWGSDASIERSLDQLAGGAVAIVAGQQVGLFSGPSYTVYKALTALRLAADLSAAGTAAVPVFWLATEDHDVAEIEHVLWPARAGVEDLELTVDRAGGRRVGEISLGETVRALVERAASATDGADAAKVARMLEESYRPQETFGSAFGKLMARTFAGRGLILLDPLWRGLHRLAAPVYRAAIDQHAELGRALAARGKALAGAGYHAQVKVTERSTLLFVSVNGERVPLRAKNDEFVLGRETVTKADLEARLATERDAFSPNVLLRPVMQDTLLPTAAYIAGPAEVAYFAQASAVYKRLSVGMPVIFPRASVTLVDKRRRQLLNKYGLEFRDILRGRAYVGSRMEQTHLPKALTAKFVKGEKALEKLLNEVLAPITLLDATLGGALDTARRKMLFQFAKLRGKAARAAALREGVIDAHEKELLGQLYPGGELQERSLCFLPTIAAQGFEVLDEITREVKLGGKQHQVLYI